MTRLAAGAQITHHTQVIAGDLVELTKDDAIVRGRVRLDSTAGGIEDFGITVHHRLLLGWAATLIEPAKRTPAPGLYVWVSWVGEDGHISTSAKVVKWKPTERWYSADGELLPAWLAEKAQEDFDRGELIGPLTAPTS